MITQGKGEMYLKVQYYEGGADRCEPMTLRCIHVLCYAIIVKAVEQCQSEVDPYNFQAKLAQLNKYLPFAVRWVSFIL